MPTDIHPETHRFLQRFDKERLLKQRGLAIWLCGLSGSGKSTIANALERVLYQQGHFSVILDGDNLRSGLNGDLGFHDQDRLENIRRTAELAKVMVNQGIITIVSVITPHGVLRDLARGILGEDFFEVFVKASYATCSRRDPNGLYAKAEAGEIENFTGRDSLFEEPQIPNLLLDTENQTIEDCTFELLEAITDRIA